MKTPSLKIDSSRYTVAVNGKEVNVTPKEFGLLTLMAHAKGRAVSRDEILRVIWPNAEVGFDTRMIDQHIARLRIALGPAAKYVVTVSGVGYRLTDAQITEGVPVFGFVERVSRSFSPKGSKVVLSVPGNVLEDLKKGDKIALA